MTGKTGDDAGREAAALSMLTAGERAAIELVLDDFLTSRDGGSERQSAPQELRALLEIAWPSSP